MKFATIFTLMFNLFTILSMTVTINSDNSFRENQIQVHDINDEESFTARVADPDGDFTGS